jgi:hypothetical protein
VKKIFRGSKISFVSNLIRKCTEKYRLTYFLRFYNNKFSSYWIFKIQLLQIQGLGFFKVGSDVRDAKLIENSQKIVEKLRNFSNACKFSNS